MKFKKFGDMNDQPDKITKRASKHFKTVITENYKDLTIAEMNSLIFYMGSGHFHINRYLRSSVMNCEEYRSLEEHINTLKGLLNRKFIPENIILYKGRRNSQSNFEGISGSIISDPGFFSTSLNPYIALGFCTGGGFTNRELLEIEIPAGTPGLILDSGESEVLLPPNMVFQTMSRTNDSTNSYQYSGYSNMKLYKLKLKFDMEKTAKLQKEKEGFFNFPIRPYRPNILLRIFGVKS